MREFTQTEKDANRIVMNEAGIGMGSVNQHPRRDIWRYLYGRRWLNRSPSHR